jgi:hypothetical protein
MSVVADSPIHFAELHPTLKAARRELEHFDAHRELYERRQRVHHLTRIGMSADEIATAIGVGGRTVARHRDRPAPPQRPLLYDGAAVTDERAQQLEDAADLALHLAAVLREEDPTVVWGALSRLNYRQVREIAVIALAAIPVEMTQAQLLAWVMDLPAARTQA